MEISVTTLFVSEAAHRLRAVAAEKKTQAEAAKDLDMTSDQLSHYMAGRKRPSLPVMVRIEDKTGILCRMWLNPAA